MKDSQNKPVMMQRPRIFLSYKGVNSSRMEHVRRLLFELGIEPRCDKEFIRDGEVYLDRIPEVMRREADAVLCLVTKEMNDAPLQCKRELDLASQLHKPLYCIRYGTGDVDPGLMYPAMTADWIWIRDPEDTEKEKAVLKQIAEAALSGRFRLEQTDTYAVLLDQADDYITYFRTAEKPALPDPFFREILPNVRSAERAEDVPLSELYASSDTPGCILLTGEGGGGKSTSVKHLTYVLQDSPYLPVYIPVRELNSEEWKGPHPVLRYIGSHILHLPAQTLDIPAFMTDFLTKLSPVYPFLFLIDGYNESSGYSGIRDDVFFLHDLPSAHMCITSRNDSGFEQRPGFTKLSAMPLSDSQIRQLNAVHPVKILTDLNDRIFDLMRNPLILTMMINAYDRKDYEALIADDLSDIGIAELIDRCILARLPKEDTQDTVFLHAGIRILLPLASAQMYFSRKLHDSIVDRYEIPEALAEIAEDILLPFRRRLYTLLDMPYGIREAEHAEEYMAEYAGLLKKDPESFCARQIIPAVHFLLNELKFLETGTSDGKMRWTHQTLTDWFIARGMALITRISSARPLEQAVLLREDWFRRTALPITDQQNDPDYDDCTEIGELLYGMLKDTFFSKGYRNLLLNVSNANGLHKATGTYAVTKSALLQAEKQYDDTPDKDPEGYVWLNGKLASAAYGLCHLNGGIPEGITEREIVLDAMRIFEQCTKNLNAYPSGTTEQQRSKRMELLRYGTLTGAAWQKLADLSKDPAEKKELNEKALQTSLRILEKRKAFLQELLSDPDASFAQIRDTYLRTAMSEAAAGSCYFRLRQYDQALACQKNAMEQRIKILENPALEAIHPLVRNEVNENRIRILGCMVRMDIPDLTVIPDWCREFLAVAEYARNGNYYRELRNAIDNFRRLLDRLEDRTQELTEDVKNILEDTAAVLSENYNSRSRKRIDLVMELPWVSLRTAPASVPKDRQCRYAEYTIRRYILSKPFQRLLKLYECPFTPTGDLDTDLVLLNEFAERWDYRKGKERQEIRASDPVASAHREEILKIADALGMMRQEISHIQKADYILVLGGANMANQTRVLLGREIADHLKDAAPAVIALGSQRILPDREKENIREFAPDAETEFDAVCAGMEDVFHLSLLLQDTHDEHGGILREWNDPEGIRRYYALCTPSVNGRRANTLDTFEHFLQLFQVPEKAEVTLATTALYCGYQLFSLLPCAMRHNIRLSIAGRPVLPTTKLSAEAFLQEIKAAINAMYAWYRTENNS